MMTRSAIGLGQYCLLLIIVLKVALRAICEYQKGTKFILPKAEFAREVANVVKTRDYKVRSNLQFEESAILALQEASESFVVGLFEDANRLAIMQKSRVVTQVDLRSAFLCAKKGKRDRYEDFYSRLPECPKDCSRKLKWKVEDIDDDSNEEDEDDDDNDDKSSPAESSSQVEVISKKKIPSTTTTDKISEDSDKDSELSWKKKDEKTEKVFSPTGKPPPPPPPGGTILSPATLNTRKGTSPIGPSHPSPPGGASLVCCSKSSSKKRKAIHTLSDISEE